MTLSKYDIFAAEVEFNKYKVVYVHCPSKSYICKETSNVEKFIDFANVIPTELIEVLLTGLKAHGYTETE